MLDRLGHVPEVGEKAVTEGIEIEVVAMEGRSIRTVRLIVLPPE